MYDTPQDTERQDRNARLMAYGIGLLIALAAIWSRFAPSAPPRPVYDAPPTPFVVETTRVEILSNNRFCVGVFEHC